MEKQSALVITNGYLDTPFAKTCHGLMRGSERFEVVAVIDSKHAGKDAGMIMEQRPNGFKVWASVQDYLNSGGAKPSHCIVGVSTIGGFLPDAIRTELRVAIQQGMSVVSGLHSFLSDDAEFSRLATQYGVELIDIRKPKPRSELKFWSGEIFKVKTPRIAVLGTDCAVGKRTTCRFLMEACRKAGIRTEMIYTGQTGWIQGSKHGFIFDTTVNDFIGGEIERVILECERESQPELMLIEGQSSLFNPTGPCGSEFLLCGNTKGVILQHPPGRIYYEDTRAPILPIERDLALISQLGAEVLAIGIHEENLSDEEAEYHKQTMEDRLGLPVIRPLKEGVSNLVPIVRDFMQRHDPENLHRWEHG